MFAMTNDKKTFIKLVENHDDPLVPLLRHNVLNHYRNFLAFMVELEWDDLTILDYIQRHADIILIKHPVNDIEHHQNETYLNYIFTQNSLRSMLTMMNNDSYRIPYTMTFIYNKILERNTRYLNIDHISMIKNHYPMLDHSQLVKRYFSINKHVNKFESAKHAINNGVIDNKNIDDVLECIRIGSGKINRDEFVKHLMNNIHNIEMNSIISRFYDRMTLLNKWV